MRTSLVRNRPEPFGVLVAIKLLHTAIWLFFVACIAAIPIAGASCPFPLGGILGWLVPLECAVIAANRGRCPLTDVAARFTEERAENFDIYLPLWLARHNKTIFGTLFAVAELYVVGQYLLSGR